MAKRIVAKPVAENDPRSRIAQAILDYVGRVPDTDEHHYAHPAKRASMIASSASRRAALTAGGLALPPGPLGWLTVLPELVAVWRIQSQMVADIAAVYGRSSHLTREQMIYCLFRHTAAQAVRDLVIRVGERYLVRAMSLRALQVVAEKIGLRISQRALGQGVSRWLPVVGAIGVGAYAFFDTAQVASTAVELFEREIEVLPARDVDDEKPVLQEKPRRAPRPRRRKPESGGA